MRVLTIVKDLNLGGTQRVAQNLTIGVRDKGEQVALLAHQALGVRTKYLEEAGITVFGPLDASGAALDAALKWLPDVVHIHRSGYPNANEAALLRRFKAMGSKIVETNVFSRFDQTIENGLIDVHAHLSDWCLMKWDMWRGRHTALATVLPNAVDVDKFRCDPPEVRSMTRARLGIPEGRFLLGRVGQPIAEKWHPKIFEVFEKGLDRGWDLGLLLIGSPTYYSSIFSNMKKSHQDRVVFLDKINDDGALNNYYSVFDAFIHMSLIGESFGMVLCEAMLCEVPVITLSTPLRDNSQCEVVRHGKGGYVSTDLSGIIEAIGKLISDPVARYTMGLCARESVIERFSVSVVADQALRIYEALLASDSRSYSGSFIQSGRGVDWMQEVLHDAFGRPSGWWNRVALSLIHNPFFYRYFRVIKQALAK